MPDERTPKGGAQGELHSVNQSAQQQQQDHADSDRDGKITKKHTEAVFYSFAADEVRCFLSYIGHDYIVPCSSLLDPARSLSCGCYKARG